MACELTVSTPQNLTLGSVELRLPTLISQEGEHTTGRFIEFFTATIRNPNTREAYGRAVRDFFVWCDQAGIGPLSDIEAIHVAAWVEQLTKGKAPQTVKQRLAAVRALFDYLVTGGILPTNPAASVRGPKYSQAKGKTPILFADDARALIRSIPTDSIAGLRDRALIAVMTYSFARVSAALSMNIEDVFTMHHRLWLRLHEKGGKYQEVPCHHNLETYLREYMGAAMLGPKTPLFRTLSGKSGVLTERRLHRTECLAMIRRRVKRAGIDTPHICNHTFRGTGITAYLSNPDARLELAQQLAGHSDPKTTRMYDRRCDEISLDEVEKIGI